MPQNAQTELSDLMLDVGASWAYGPTAAALHGLDGFTLKKPFHVLVLRGRNIQRVGAFVHTTTQLSLIDRASVGDFAVTSPSRTLVDLAADTTSEVLLTAVASAFRDGLSSETFLHERLLALRGRGRAGTRRLADILDDADIRAGRPSWLERRFLELLAQANLPTPQTEVVLTRARSKLVRVDCFFAGTRVVVELLGYRWHRTKEQLRCDTERLNQLLLDGFLAYQFPYDQVVEEPGSVVTTVRLALGL
jgi:hypothetical protein